MVMFANQRKSSLAHQHHNWEPVVSIPFDEQTVLRLLDTNFEREADKQALADFARIDDDEMLSALVDAGFTPATLPALQLAPIAFIAWASSSVSDKECEAAVSSIYETRLHEFPSAMGRVQSWLERRPDQALWDLWIAFTALRLSGSPRFVGQPMGRQLLRHATQVALASGGIWGFGSVCAAENVVLEDIRNVYYMRRSWLQAVVR